jgi:hypothetical protein
VQFQPFQKLGNGCDFIRLFRSGDLPQTPN